MDALRDGAALEDLSGLIEAARSEMNEGEEGGSEGAKGKAGEKGKRASMRHGSARQD